MVQGLDWTPSGKAAICGLFGAEGQSGEDLFDIS
jgi:hypothetical protein